jgi:hypothetical protein
MWVILMISICVWLAYLLAWTLYVSVILENNFSDNGIFCCFFYFPSTSVLMYLLLVRERLDVF